MIVVKNVTHDFLGTRALNNVSFTLKQGSIAALIGPNGAGKTTLMRCISTLQSLQSGEIFVNGIDISKDPREVHRHIGYLADNFGLYDELTARQSLTFIANTRMENIENLDALIQECATETGMLDFLDKKINTLSRGMRQRVGIAQAIIHKPKLVLLDEPASGLDPEARISLSQLLISFRNKGMTMIVSSHILSELEDYSTEMLILKNGQLIEQSLINTRVDGTIETVNVFKVLADNLNEALVELIKQSFPTAVSKVVFENHEITFSLDEEQCKQHEILGFMVQAGIQVKEFSAVKKNLQSEYLKTINSNT